MTVRRWVRVCSLRELEEGRGVAALVEQRQVALFLLPGAEGHPASRLRAVDNWDPVSQANVLSRGLLGSVGSVDYIASPLHKHRFDLATGACLDGKSPGVRVWPVRVWGSTVEVLFVSDALAPDAMGDGGEGQVTDTSGVATHCPFCALQCGMTATAPSADAPVEVKGDARFPVNEGRLCVKGWSAGGLMGLPDRLVTPMVRTGDGELRSATWDAALDELAERLSGLRDRYGADAIGVFGSGALTNEKAYLLGKFARVAVGTAQIDYNGRFCMASAAAAQNRAFGVDRGLPFPLADIAKTGTLVLWGANPADTMPPLMAWVEKMSAAGGQLIVVDPRRTGTAEAADEHVQPVPGSDMAVALGLLHLAVATRAVDQDYLAARTTGSEEVLTSVRDWTPERVERVSGVPVAQLRRLFDALARPAASMLLTGRGPEQQSKGVDTVSTLIHLMLALGKVGKPHSGYGCLTGQANGQGGREHGQKADQLPGYRSISDPEARAAVAAVWGVDPARLPGPGRSAVEMLSSIGDPDGLRALLVAGSDVVVAAPGVGRSRRALAGLDCLAVLDAFPGETAEHADFLLPVAQWAEEEGTLTNLEGRVLRRRRVVDPPAGVRSDIEILCALAGRLGAKEGFSFAGPTDVFDELRRATAGAAADYAGITYERLDAGDVLHWPCPSTDHPGTPRLFAERFAHPDGKARMVAVSYRPSAEPVDAEYPVWFTTGRHREHYNTGNQTRRLKGLAERRPEARLQVHPTLARAMNLREGDWVTVESRRAEVRFRVELSEDIRPDTVFAPIHWGGDAAANLLTNPALDPISRMPEFKVCAVRLRAASDGDLTAGTDTSGTAGAKTSRASAVATATTAAS